jgi:sporulation protein YlmC with PRC-barrel domain
MNRDFRRLAALLVLAGTGGVALAQNDQPPQPDPKPHPGDKTEGRDTPPMRDKDARMMDKSDRDVILISGEQAMGKDVRGLNDEKVGDINDLLISRPDGRVSIALIGHGGVLGIGEKVIAVPYDALSCNHKDRVYMLPISKDRLKAAPALEKGEWRTLSEPSKLDTSYTYFGLTRPTGPNADDRAYATEAHSALKTADWPLLRVSDVRGQKLMADDGRELGKVDDVVFDANSGRIAFAVVKFGGFLGMGEDRVAVPWTVFDVNKDGKLFAVNLDQEAVKAAPRITKSDWSEIREPGYGTRVYKHYNRKAEWLDRQRADATGVKSVDDYNRLYTGASPRVVAGTVRDIDETSPVTGASEIECISLTTEDGKTVAVHCAPKSYMTENHMNFKPGDRVTVEGRWVDVGGEPYLIATRISPANGQPIVLRRADGTTVWIWR